VTELYTIRVETIQGILVNNSFNECDTIPTQSPPHDTPPGKNNSRSQLCQEDEGELAS
jgi:hypothetical protein